MRRAARRPIQALAALGALLTLVGCGDRGDVVAPTADFPRMAAGVVPVGPFCGAAHVVPLMAGRTNEVGTVTVQNDADHIVVTYRTSGGASIHATVLFVGHSVADIPQTRSGNPKIGHFPHKASYADGTTQVVWTLDRIGAPGETVVVAAYAETGDGEGAWAEGDPIGDGGSWAMQFGYVVQSCAGDAFVTVPCPALSLSAASAMPLDQLPIGSLPASLVPPLAGTVTWAGGSEEGLTYVDRGDDGTATLLVPVHPTGSVDGGDVSIRINDGTRACPAVSLHIDALPPAPGEFSGIVDELQQIIALQASLVGTTADDLKGVDPDTLDPGLLPLAIAEDLIDGPDNLNSLRKLADGTSDAGVDVTMLNRLMARTGMKEGLATALANANTAASSVLSAGAASPSGPAPQAASARSPSSSLAPEAAAEVVEVDCLTLPIETAQRLNDCMNIAESAAFQLQGVAAEQTENLTNLFAVAGLAGLEAVTGPAEVVLWVYQKLAEGTANLLPSEFSGIDITAAPKTFLQDEDGPGAWDAFVGATSKGWELDKVALETLLQIAGIAGNEEAWFTKYIPDELVQRVAGFLQTKFVEKAIGITEGSDFIKIEPELWGPISIGAEQWSVRSLFSDAFELTAWNNYEPRAVGKGNLHVGTRKGGPDELIFGGRSIETDQDTVLEVTPISLDFFRGGTPVSEITVKESETVELTLLVQDAMHPERVILQPGQKLAGTATLAYDGVQSYKLTYTAPSNLGVLPEDIVVEDTAHTGSLATSGETPTAKLAVLPGGVTITPRSACVQWGDTARFTALVTGVTDKTVQWNASLGTITSDGLYTAPSDAPDGTQVMIIATSVENPDLADTVSIRVGNCHCRFDASVTGAFAGSYEGPAGFYDVGGAFSVELDGNQDPGTGTWLQSGGFMTTTAVTGTGVYQIASGSMNDAASGLTVIYNPDSGFDGSGTVTITDFTQNEIAGSFSFQGGVIEAGVDQPQPATAIGTFSASRASPPYDGLFSPFMQCKVNWAP